MLLTAILLAAGQSKRMGLNSAKSSPVKRNKLLLPYKKTTQAIILHILKKVFQSNIPQIIVVVGYQSRKLRTIVQSSQLLKSGRRKCSLDFVENRNYRSGLASSICAGMNGISSDTDAVLIFLGDQPDISVQTMHKIIRRATRSRKSVVVPVYQGQNGHPVLFKKKYFNQLRRLASLSGKKVRGARVLLENNPNDISFVKVNDQGIIRDIDTWQDYQSITNL
ncbi:MAG: nucleotidyltransferase family protein [bacterium]|nr:nucleotidyltransferase family protein [bacterium]